LAAACCAFSVGRSNERNVGVLWPGLPPLVAR